MLKAKGVADNTALWCARTRILSLFRIALSFPDYYPCSIWMTDYYACSITNHSEAKLAFNIKTSCTYIATESKHKRTIFA